MFAKDLDVDLLDLGPESCQVIDVQENFNARGRQELGMATKTLLPFPSGGKYSLKDLFWEDTFKKVDTNPWRMRQPQWICFNGECE